MHAANPVEQLQFSTELLANYATVATLIKTT